MAAPRPLRLLLAACAAWLVLYELHVVLVPELDAGLLFSRFAHDVVLVVAALCLARVPSVHGPERLAWPLIGSGLLAWSVGEIYYTAVLWDDPDPPIPSLADAGYLLFPPLVLRRRARAAAPPRPRHPAPAVGRRRSPPRSAVAALSAAIVFETVLDSVTASRSAVVTSLAYPLHRPRPARPHRRRRSPAPGGGWTARGCCSPAASRLLARRLAVPRAAPPRASTSPAAGSTPAGGPAWP